MRCLPGWSAESVAFCCNQEKRKGRYVCTVGLRTTYRRTVVRSEPAGVFLIFTTFVPEYLDIDFENYDYLLVHFLTQPFPKSRVLTHLLYHTIHTVSRLPLIQKTTTRTEPKGSASTRNLFHCIHTWVNNQK